MQRDRFERGLGKTIRHFSSDGPNNFSVEERRGQLSRFRVGCGVADQPNDNPLVRFLCFDQDPELFAGFRVASCSAGRRRAVPVSGFASGGVSISTVPILESAGHSLLLTRTALLELSVGAGCEAVGARWVEAHARRERHHRLAQMRLRLRCSAFFRRVKRQSRRDRRGRRRVDLGRARGDVDRWFEGDGVAADLLNLGPRRAFDPCFDRRRATGEGRVRIFTRLGSEEGRVELFVWVQCGLKQVVGLVM